MPFLTQSPNSVSKEILASVLNETTPVSHETTPMLTSSVIASPDLTRTGEWIIGVPVEDMYRTIIGYAHLDYDLCSKEHIVPDVLGKWFSPLESKTGQCYALAVEGGPFRSFSGVFTTDETGRIPLPGDGKWKVTYVIFYPTGVTPPNVYVEDSVHDQDIEQEQYPDSAHCEDYGWDRDDL